MGVDPVVFRVAPVGGPNYESMEHHRFCSRATGHLGSGRYVLIKKPALSGTCAVLSWPWEKPFYIQSEQELIDFNGLSEYICKVASHPSMQVDNDRLALLLASFPVPGVNMQQCREAVRMARAPGSVVQPINYIMMPEFDGIVNTALDTFEFGSVHYHINPTRRPVKKLVSKKRTAPSQIK
jgi:hypothetical protein